MNDAPGRVSPRTKWSYGIGCIGRDATYTLVTNFIMTYLTMAVGLSDWQLFMVGVIMIAARVWDAVNDPMMGTIIDNTHTRFGRFKPYIIAGALLNAFFTVLLYSNPTGNQNEGLFLVVFGISYVLWGMTYTMNDIAYWGMLPSLTQNAKEREKVTSVARIGANVGLFAATAAVPMLTAGGLASMYRPIAAVVAAVFVVCQMLVVWGVQEKTGILTKKDGHTTLKDMVGIVLKNDQLLVVAGAILLFNIGYFTTTGFGVQFFYFDYGHFGGMEFTLFALCIGVAQIATLALFPLLSRRLNRRGQFALGFCLVLAGYAGFLAVGYVLPMHMAVLCVIGLVLFSGQAVIQLLNYIMLADCVEYGQWKLGTRNDSIVYSLNPFITKLASAVQAGIFSLTLILSGLNAYSEKISRLESEMGALGAGTGAAREAILAEGNAIVAAIPGSATFIMRLFMVALPLCLIAACYLIWRKKYRIDEKLYAQILADLNARRQPPEP